MSEFTLTDGVARIRNAKDFDPVVAGGIFKRLAKERGGNFSPEDVWKEAEHEPNHPLRKHYDWDLREAAEKHWTDQSRAMIRLVSITMPNMQKPTRAFVSFPSETGMPKYHPIVDVVRSDDFLARLLLQAQRDAEAMVKRYNMYSELCEIVQAAKKTAEAAKKQHDEFVSRRRKRPDGDQPPA